MPRRWCARFADRESWIERVESIRLKAIVLWERTPRGIEQKRRELQKHHPDADLAKSRDLRVQTRQIIELAYDKARIRLRVEDVGDREDLRIWDGKRFILRNRDEMAPDRNRCLITRDQGIGYHSSLWSDFQSFRRPSSLPVGRPQGLRSSSGPDGQTGGIRL